ncbi:MAG: pyruvate kinase [Bacteroidota bacterium]
MKHEIELGLLIDAIEMRIEFLKEKEEEFGDIIASLHENHQDCGRNLIHYLALRSMKLRSLQAYLANLGLSSMSYSDGYTLANMTNILSMLHHKNGTVDQFEYDPDDFKINYFTSKDMLISNKRRLFGRSDRKKSRAHIMVTMPTEAAENTELLKKLLISGMNVARINCSHDNPEIWKKIIDNIKTLETELGHPCKIYMDLAGPKLRTGPIEEIEGKNKNKKKAHITVIKGDILEIYREQILGTQPVINGEGHMEQPGKISITLESVFDDVKVGEHIWFDDGKIGGRILDVTPDVMKVEITHSHIAGSKLRSEKGVNFPETALSTASLTAYDIETLPFMAEHADMIGYSFVRKPEDVKQLQDELKKLGRENKGIILKIETKEAFNNLPDLLLQAMKGPMAGVMIARGDLAVEIGFNRIAEVQEQILWICEAAHIPIIWATQVLDRLAKKGLATRAEVTDAAMSGRAECVMLNKGPYIEHAVKMLDNILQRMYSHQLKKKGSLRRLNVAKRFFRKEKEEKTSEQEQPTAE